MVYDGSIWILYYSLSGEDDDQMTNQQILGYPILRETHEETHVSAQVCPEYSGAKQGVRGGTSPEHRLSGYQVIVLVPQVAIHHKTGKLGEFEPEVVLLWSQGKNFNCTLT